MCDQWTVPSCQFLQQCASLYVERMFDGSNKCLYNEQKPLRIAMIYRHSNICMFPYIVVKQRRVKPLATQYMSVSSHLHQICSIWHCDFLLILTLSLFMSCNLKSTLFVFCQKCIIISALLPCCCLLCKKHKARVMEVKLSRHVCNSLVASALPCWLAASCRSWPRPRSQRSSLKLTAWTERNNMAAISFCSS